MSEIRENKQEIYKAEDLFRFFQEKYNVPNSEETKRQLMEHGMEPKDIDASFELMTCVLGVDANVENLQGIRLEFNAAKDTKKLAGYRPAAEGELEKYIAFVDGSADEITRRCRGRKMTKQEVVLQVAIHEVRHRLQFTEGFKKFKAENSIDEFESDSELIENLAIDEIRKGVALDDLIKTITRQAK